MKLDFEKVTEEIKRVRTFNGLTQENLAEQIGVHAQTICKLESGHLGVSAKTLIDAIKALGITITMEVFK